MLTTIAAKRPKQAAMPSRVPARCLCGNVMGHLTEVNGQVRLNAGGWLIADGAGKCPRCGRPFVFRPPKAGWPEIVRRYDKLQSRP